MPPNQNNNSGDAKALLGLVFGVTLGVLSPFLFGRGTHPEYVATQNYETAAPAQSGAGTVSNAGQKTPVEGEGASGSAGSAAQGKPTAAAEAGLMLEQQVMDTAFQGSGAEIYQQACQSCHMPGGKGAEGAGNYPALAKNPKLSNATYPLMMVISGNGGMPGFGHYMSDEQISEVVNYIRTELNDNKDKIKPEDVKKMRQPEQHYMIFGEAAG